MLLFLRDADVVDEWLKTQQTLLESGESEFGGVDLDQCQKEIQDLDKQQGHARAFEERLNSVKKQTTFEHQEQQAAEKRLENEKLREEEQSATSESTKTPEKPIRAPDSEASRTTSEIPTTNGELSVN